MKTLFNFLALCLGFLMVVGTIGLVSVGTAMFLGVRPNDEELIIVVLAITVGFLLFARIARGFMERLTPQVPVAEPHDTMAKDETRVMQEIYKGLKRMDERVESLETILIERSRDRSRDTADRY
jgi:cytochrome c biogenesis protein CcdA